MSPVPPKFKQQKSSLLLMEKNEISKSLIKKKKACLAYYILYFYTSPFLKKIKEQSLKTNMAYSVTGINSRIRAMHNRAHSKKERA